jgi:DNA-binding beta-propeller fold protein YncE
MNRRIVSSVFLAVAAVTASHAQQSAPLRLVQTITLPVTGKFDHMAVDPKNDRAFVAASGHSTVEVLDLKTGKWIKSIPGKGKPAGFVYSAAMDRVIYSTDAGSLRILNPNTFEIEEDMSLAVGADSMGLDTQTQIVYVDNGGRVSKEDFTRVSPVDLKTHKNLGDIKVEGGKLEAITFEVHGHRGFINDTASNKVVVFDREKRTLIDSWDITVAKENVPMVLNESEHRLIVGARQPGTLVVLDTQTGKTVAHVPATGFADDLSYDVTRKRVYMSGGDGFLDVYQEKDPDTYVQIAKIPTREGARTSKWVPEQNRLYVELPALKPGDAAEVQVYEAIN